MFDKQNPVAAPRIWEVGALCRAIADALEARFNPVAVRGEITGFSRASSGHCYFSIKDAQGQLRCAMFRRAAGLLDFSPRDGELVEVRGRLGVYEARGDLQFIVESMQRAGQGALFEQFLRLKAQLDAEGLFDATRKRPLPLLPRGIGLVTSPGAAALHDVVTALRRRVPHIPVVLVPAQVQGAAAPASLVLALSKLYLLAQAGQAGQAPEASMNEGPPIDVILLVRGGGSIEDLWAFNDERLARTIVQSPVPLVCGVGHETDFTIADFCADLRAPTPTAAAELVAQPRDVWLGALGLLAGRIEDGVQRQLDLRHQRLEDPVPEGPFDLVFSALAVHHLDGPGKADLFARVAAVLEPGGRFVLADVVVPDDPADATTPLSPDYDLPSRADDQLGWLREAGLDATVAWAERDLAVIVAVRPSASAAAG